LIGARVAATVALLSVGAADAAHAQHLRAAERAWRSARPALESLPAEAGAPADLRGVPGGATGVAASAGVERARTRRWWAPLASAVAPGAGQLALRQDRALAYLAVEAFAWVQYGVALREGQRERGAYRELARTVARAYYGPDRPTGNFEYYERMEHFVESGSYDLDPTDGRLQPELDEATFNGSVWLLARQTYWEDPATAPSDDSRAYLDAVAFYERRAVRPEYRWSWRNAQLEQDLFRRTIGTSNDAYRRSVQYLGAVIANHVLSTVDAYVTVRLYADEGDRYGFDASLPLSLPRRRR
jgi:hypothetical protein